MERIHVVARQCCRWGLQSGKMSPKTHFQNSRSFQCTNNKKTIRAGHKHARGQCCVKGQVSLLGQGHTTWPVKEIVPLAITRNSFATTSLSANGNNASETETNNNVTSNVKLSAKHKSDLGDDIENDCLLARKMPYDNSELKCNSNQQLFNESASKEEIFNLEVIDTKEDALQRNEDLSKGGNLDIYNEGEVIPLKDLPRKRVIKPIYNFAAIVNKSETLANFVKMGVDLSTIEKDRGATDLLVRLDFEKDVKPVILFLHDIGVASGDLGNIITKYPRIFLLSLQDMRNTVDYFRSKNFVAESITRIVIKAPGMLEQSVMDIDTQLGGYQTAFRLTGTELRDVVTRLPKLLTWHVQRVKDVNFYMKEFLGFSVSEIKDIFIAHPKVLLSGKHQLGKRFDFLYNEMKITHNALVAYPQVFRTRVPLIKQRHLFLKQVGRDQYDPKKENYVSLKALVTYKDRDLAFHLAKTSVAQFNDFLKTM